MSSETATREIAITFEPSGRTVHVLPGSTVLEAAALAGLAIVTPCGGEGTCGKCRVRFMTSPPEMLAADREQLNDDQLADGWRLSCHHTLEGVSRLHVPPESVYGTAEQILVSDQRVTIEIQPAARRRFVKLEPPTMADDRSDLTRLRDALEEPKVKVSADVLRRLPGLLRANDWAVTVTLTNGHVCEIEGGKIDRPVLGVAFDIGTTTIVGTLLNLADGSEMGVSARINPQVAHGDDVVARIQACREEADGLRRLHEAVIAGLGEMIRKLADDAGADTRDICEVTVAGNMTMQLLTAGVDPSPLGEMPFAAGFSTAMMLEADELGLPIHPRGRGYLLPGIAGFLGGDTVAGLLATGLGELPGASLLIDIGTNGEIVLARDGRMWAASTAAGPAFEGARISQGMRATAGAIEKVVIDGDEVRINVIGNAAPVGLCGTALIDAAAGMLDAGVLEVTGRLTAPDGRPGLAARLVGEGPQTRFVLADGADGRDPVAVTQKDIRELQLASGAIRAGVAILMEKAGVTADQIDNVFLAGAFGNYIRRENARRIGLLPDVPIERIHFVGNAASMGAKLALLSTIARTRAEDLAARVEHVDLSSDLNFQMKFADAMIFPDPQE